MRITGGELRGRRLKVPTRGHVRPTQDSVREALFSMLSTRVPDSVFLDLFAGSGSVGIEAWSRGARSVVWVEGTASVARILADNVNALCDGEGRIVQNDVFRWLKGRRDEGDPFEIVFADPPYGDENTEDRIPELMELLAQSGRMAREGLLVVEQRTRTPMPKARGWTRIKDRRYGHTRITLFRFDTHRETSSPPVTGSADPS